MFKLNLSQIEKSGLIDAVNKGVEPKRGLLHADAMYDIQKAFNLYEEK